MPVKKNLPASAKPAPNQAPVGLGRMMSDPAVTFPVVAIGGSAGALEAYERFFGQLPNPCGVAIVVVQHLLANQPSSLPELLRSFTSLPVVEITDGMVMRADYVYVAPPGQDLSLLQGRLLLLEPPLPAAQRLPIDFFFQSLAKDARERAVCIIFSGGGSDGALGLKLVMENFGMVMVQDPATAAYDAMPRAALATEFVDFVLAPELMPAQLLDYVARLEQVRLPRRVARELPGHERSDEDDSLSSGTVRRPAHALQKIFLLIRQQTGHDFSLYKRNTVFRRIERRMNSHQIQEFSQYVRYLQENPTEVAQLFKELLIGVTKFFRDAEAFASLKVHLRELLASRPTGSTIRVWAPGCSTGEETYSLTMLLHECVSELGADHHLKLQLFATDLNPDGVDVARRGIYSTNIEADVSAERLAKYFIRVPEGYQIRKEVREMVVFAVHNLHRDAPFTKLDLLVCRNLLIYLNAELQRNLMPVFHYALQPGGLLFLGPSESMSGLSEFFAPLDVKWKILRRQEVAGPMAPPVSFFPVSPRLPLQPAESSPPVSAMSYHPTARPARRDGNTFATLVQQRLLLHYAPPAVVANAKGEILFVNGRTGRYLEPAPGLGTLNMLEMAREGLNYELGNAVQQAVQTRADVTVDEVRVRTDAGPQRLRLQVRYLREPEVLAGLLLITFEEQPAAPRSVRRRKGAPTPEESERDALVQALDRELQYTKHRLQATLEEMEGSLEELKSTNEELQSANEELQSTNEETMTNKEEMQSLNEELLTLNLEYQTKSEELSQVAANDLRHLLDATEIGILFVDNELVIRRFTSSVGRIIHLVPGDEGRPLAHFAPNLREGQLLAQTQQVLNTLMPHESQVQTTSGEWFSLRIMPYRTRDNYISGAVLTFTNIYQLKQLESRLQARLRLAESIVAAVREPLLALDADLRLLALNPTFAQLFGLNPAAEPGQPLTALNGTSWQPPGLHQLLLPLLAPHGPAELSGPPLEASTALGPRRLYVRRLGPGQEGWPMGVLVGVEPGDH